MTFNKVLGGNSVTPSLPLLPGCCLQCSSIKVQVRTVKQRGSALWRWWTQHSGCDLPLPKHSTATSTRGFESCTSPELKQCYVRPSTQLATCCLWMRTRAWQAYSDAFKTIIQMMQKLFYVPPNIKAYKLQKYSWNVPLVWELTPIIDGKSLDQLKGLAQVRQQSWECSSSSLSDALDFRWSPEKVVSVNCRELHMWRYKAGMFESTGGRLSLLPIKLLHLF